MLYFMKKSDVILVIVSVVILSINHHHRLHSWVHRLPFSCSHTTHARFLLPWPIYNIQQHSSYGDCLEVKREYYQNCSVLGCVTKCSQSAAHSCEQFLRRSSRLGLSHWDPYVMHRGGCLELYYCNMVEWSWWDSSLIWKTNWFPSVLWHC